MDIEISFPGGKRVEAVAGNFRIATDQPVEDGGEGSAPAPFTLFLASLGTCAGLYVLAFCKARGISTEGVRLTQRSEKDSKGRLARVAIDVHVPSHFPERYREGVAHAAAACKVKKTIADPPAFDVLTVVDERGFGAVNAAANDG
jgi:ribosomal protein S12 methylthiotransferase accessory factor